ncbi:MAG: alpha/beta hydrolase [Syntrophomonadaceae bacterium]|nr:alpha/beta hydrolase [Syntrophomonadaceae bacterium]
MGNYSESSGNYSGQGGILLYWHAWKVAEPKVVVVLVHGLGEHGARYANLINHMQGDNVSFYTQDHRGHGRSQGARGHITSFMEYVDDLKLLVGMAHDQNPGVPLILLGHSMGGAIAARYALEYPAYINALILSAAGLIPSMAVPGWQDKLARFLSRVAPATTFPNGLSVDDLSHDPQVIKAYVDDPLVHNKISARWYTEMLNNSQQVLSRAAQLNMPLLVVHGGGDKIVDIAGSDRVFIAASSKDKIYKSFPGLFHETMNETMPEREEVLNAITAWILDHVDK